MAWLGGAMLLVSRQGFARRAILTLALCPGGLVAPLWFHGAGMEPRILAAEVAYPMAAAMLAANLVAAWRLLQE